MSWAYMHRGEASRRESAATRIVGSPLMVIKGAVLVVPHPRGKLAMGALHQQGTLLGARTEQM